MTSYADMTVGEQREVPAGDGTAIVTRAELALITVARHYDGSWNTVVWVRADDGGWRVSRERAVIGEFFDDLDLALEEAIDRSHEALN